MIKIDTEILIEIMKILVVDDEESVRKVVELILMKKLDHQVITASNPKEALELLEGGQFDLVLTGLSMGKPLAGFHLLVEIRNRFPKISVILMSSDFPFGLKEKAMKKGAKATLDKSTKFFEALIATVKQCSPPAGD